MYIHTHIYIASMRRSLKKAIRHPGKANGSQSQRSQTSSIASSLTSPGRPVSSRNGFASVGGSNRFLYRICVLYLYRMCSLLLQNVFSIECVLYFSEFSLGAPKLSPHLSIGPHLGSHLLSIHVQVQLCINVHFAWPTCGVTFGDI